MTPDLLLSPSLHRLLKRARHGIIVDGRSFYLLPGAGDSDFVWEMIGGLLSDGSGGRDSYRSIAEGCAWEWIRRG